MTQLVVCRSLALCRKVKAIRKLIAEPGTKAENAPNTVCHFYEVQLICWFGDICCTIAANCGVKSSSRKTANALAFVVLKLFCPADVLVRWIGSCWERIVTCFPVALLFFAYLACCIPFCTLTFLNLFCVCHTYNWALPYFEWSYLNPWRFTLWCYLNIPFVLAFWYNTNRLLDVFSSKICVLLL